MFVVSEQSYEVYEVLAAWPIIVSASYLEPGPRKIEDADGDRLAPIESRDAS